MTFTRLASALIFALAATAACAESLIKPLPEPDLSRLDKGVAAQLQENRANFEKARKELLGPQLAQSYALIASSYYAAGFQDVAATALDNAVSLMPDDGRWLYLQGVLAETRSQPSPAAALDYYQRAFLVDKVYLPIRIALISALANQGNIDRARTVADEGMKDFGDTAVLQLVRAQIAVKQGRWADALSAANDGIKIDAEATQLYTLQAMAYDGLGNAEAAKTARAKAGNVSPLMSDPLREGFLGGGRATQQQDAAKADPQSTPLLRASFFLSAGKLDQARKELDAALKEKPGDVGILGLSARTEALAGNRSAAASRAAEGVRAAPNDPQAYITRGIVAETAGDEDAARSDYERAIKLDPKVVEARLLLGHYLMRKGQYAQAAEQYRQIIAVDPQRFETYGNLVAAQYSEGRCAESLKVLNDAMRPNSRQGFLVQVFARVASTCPAANDVERSMALELAGKIYAQNAMPQIAESLALAQAANGKFDEAVQVQGAAIFTAVRDAGQPAAAPFQEFFKLFQAKQLPKQPWPLNSPFFKPERLQPAPQQQAAAPAAKPAG